LGTDAIDFPTLIDLEVAARSSSWNRLVGKWSRSDADTREFLKASLGFDGFCLCRFYLSFDGLGETGRRTPVGIELAHLAYHSIRVSLNGGKLSLLPGRSFNELATAKADLT
jgi:hypothetical protein